VTTTPTIGTQPLAAVSSGITVTDSAVSTAPTTAPINAGPSSAPHVGPAPVLPSCKLAPVVAESTRPHVQTLIVGSEDVIFTKPDPHPLVGKPLRYPNGATYMSDATGSFFRCDPTRS